MTTPHITDEALAAFADGRLGRTERARVTEHLDACPPCREIAAETVRAREEIVDVEAFTERRVSGRVLGWSMAAAALMLIAAFVWVGPQDAPDLPSPTASLSYVIDRTVSEPATRPDPGGYAFGPTTDRDRVSFALGRELVLMTRAMVLEDKAGTERAGRVVATLLPLAGAEVSVAAELERFIETVGLIDSMRDTGAVVMPRGLASSIPDDPHGMFALGCWVEAAWIAASTQDASFFDAAEIRALREAIGASPVGAPAAPILEDLETETDFRRIRRLLTDLTEVIR